MGNFESARITSNTEIDQSKTLENEEGSTYEVPSETPTALAEEVKRVQETTESKEESASYGTQLLEHLTGLKIDDPKILEKLVEDKKRIRTKYNLPHEAMAKIFPAEYERRLRELAKEFQTDIRSKAEFEKFFERHSHAAALYDPPEKNIVADVNKHESLEEYTKSLATLEHEVIHAIQRVRSPGMPIEVQEYEAYLGANFHNLEELHNDPDREEVLDTLFTYQVGVSVNHWYHEQSDMLKEEVRPDWLV